MPDTRSRMFRIRCTFPYLLQLPNLSLHNNCFRRTDVNTGFAVNTQFLVNFRFFVLDGDCRSGTLIHACLASGTFTGVNDCNQFIHSIVYVGEKIKNRFRCKHSEKNHKFCSFQAEGMKKHRVIMGGSQSFHNPVWSGYYRFEHRRETGYGLYREIRVLCILIVIFTFLYSEKKTLNSDFACRWCDRLRWIWKDISTYSRLWWTPPHQKGTPPRRIS